jgi:hypothetical protein
MQDLIKRETLAMLFVVGGFAIAFALAVTFMPRKGDVVIINCDISEISPDFTPEMREACRQVRAGNILQKPK